MPYTQPMAVTSFIIITYVEYETETEHESWQLSDRSSCHRLRHQGLVMAILNVNIASASLTCCGQYGIIMPKHNNVFRE